MSETYIAALDADRALHSNYNASGTGIPYAVVDSSISKSPVAFMYDTVSDMGPYPIPPDPPIQKEGAGQDRHMLLVHTEECTLYELFGAELRTSGWHAGSGAIWDLRANAQRPQGWGSADAAGLPIFPGLVRYDEIEAGAIRHALRFASPITQNAYVFPATHAVSNKTDARLPPMGLRLRLKADVDISGLPARVQVILVALKKYGMFLADNGPPNASHLYIDGAPDARWDDFEMQSLMQVHLRDFEALETGPLTPGT